MGERFDLPWPRHVSPGVGTAAAMPGAEMPQAVCLTPILLKLTARPLPRGRMATIWGWGGGGGTGWDPGLGEWVAENPSHGGPSQRGGIVQEGIRGFKPWSMLHCPKFKDKMIQNFKIALAACPRSSAFCTVSTAVKAHLLGKAVFFLC